MNTTTNGTIDLTIFPKICSVIILPTLSFIAGILPLKLGEKYYNAHRTSNEVTLFEKIMTFCSYFGGGVLLCTIFLHLVPEIRENVETLQRKGILNAFPLSFPELVLCIGFFLIFSVEELLHTYINHPAERVDVKKPMQKNGLEKVFIVEKIENLTRIREEDRNVSGNEQEHINNGSNCNKNYHSCTSPNCHSLEHRLSISFENHDHIYIPPFDKSVLHGFVIVLALSIHELFEGLAVGLEPKASMVWYLLTAISCHKVVLAAFIGVQFLMTHVKPRIAYIYVLAFAATSPMGIIVGTLMSTHATASDSLAILSATLQSMATGTLLYIVFFEVYAKQFSTYKLPGVTKVLSSATGFMFMAFLQMELDEN